MTSEAVAQLPFVQRLTERAASARRRIVLPEGEDPRVLRAAQILGELDACDVVVLGDPVAIRARAGSADLDLGKAEIVDAADDQRCERYAAEYAQLRAHKGVTRAAARQAMTQRAYLATMMVYSGEVDGMVSGAAHTTAETIRPAFEIIRTAPDADGVSSVFFMLFPDQVRVFGDCAVTPDPSAAQLADIARASARTAEHFDVDPKVAMLSYSSGSSGSGPSVDVVREAVKQLAQDDPPLCVEGPLQYDAAVNQEIAAAKASGSPVAGKATVLIFPSLDAGNIAYKAVQQSAGVPAIGPILQGLNRPVNDLSRGCTVPDIVNTVLVTAVQAQF